MATITIEVAEDLLERARKAAGADVEQTIIRGLQMVAAVPAPASPEMTGGPRRSESKREGRGLRAFLMFHPSSRPGVRRARRAGNRRDDSYDALLALRGTVHLRYDFDELRRDRD